MCIRDSQYGMGTKIENAVGVKDFSKRAESFGLNTLHINDLDVENAYYKSKEIIDSARKFQPGFIEVECYRFYGHARMDKSPYRDEKEENEKRQLDPISFASNQMLKNNILDETEIKKIDDEVMTEMDNAMEFAINSPINDEKEIFRDVYSESDPLPISLDEKINKISSLFDSVEFGHPDMREADKTFYLLRGIGFVNDFSAFLFVGFSPLEFSGLPAHFFAGMILSTLVGIESTSRRDTCCLL